MTAAFINFVFRLHCLKLRDVRQGGRAVGVVHELAGLPHDAHTHRTLG